MPKTSTKHNLYISVQEAAHYLGITRMGVVKRIHKGQIKAEKIGRSYAIPKSAILPEFSDTPVTQHISDVTYLSVPQVAHKLGLTRVAVFQRIKRGEISARKVGRHYVIAYPLGKTVSDTQTVSDVPMLSLPQVAEAMGVHRNTIFQKVKKGMIKATQVGRHYCVAGNFVYPVLDVVEVDVPEKDQDYVSIAEYARQAGVSRIAVYKRVKKGLIPARRIGRSFAIPKREFDQIKQ